MKDRTTMMLLRSGLAALVLVSIAGCSLFDSTKSQEYKGAQARVAQPLEVPPELTSPTMDDRYAIPDPRAQTSYSQYSQQQKGTPAENAQPAVLPKVEGGRLERGGDQRWLVVKGTPEQVWPVVRQFWIDSGYTLTVEEPAIGIMETDWHEDRTKIPDDIIRRTVGKVFDKMWSTPRRDKFRTRLEKGVEPNTTEVIMSNRAMEEIYVSNTQDQTRWQALPADREAEAEMLSRLLLKIGGPEATTQTASLDKSKGAPTRATQPPPPESRNAVLENASGGPLVVNDGFDRAWRRVGLALDRVGFTVEDRDRSKGLFFVRYIDPEAEAPKTAGEKTSFVDKLMFWRAPPKGSQPQYRIHVADSGTNTSQVQVQNSQGVPENSATGRKILGLLYEQLK
jgi:outer membrane protein assembly factor BamC